MSRSDRVVFELPKPIDDPKNFNWFFPGVRREQGAHQAMFEPLFLFNYRTGALDPWLAKSITPNDKQDVWTLKLRDDVKWSDSKPGQEPPFAADDVVFTANLVLRSNFVPAAYEAVSFRSQVKVDGVKKIDGTTVEFTLNKANPRFALETFGGTMFSSFLIMPQHVWVNQDPTQFPFYSADFSTPVGTGPYKLKESDKTHTLWVRDDNWWGAKKGANGKPVFRPLPEPKELEWLVVDNLTDSKNKLTAGDLDAARPYALDDFNDVKSQNPKIVGWDPSSALAWNDPCARQIDIYTPANKLDGTPNVWSDPSLRKALSLLIDRTRLAHEGYKDTTTPSKTMFAQYEPMNTFINEVVNQGYGVKPTADPAAADALLTSLASGYAKDPADGYYKKGGARLAATLKVDSSIAPDVDGANALSEQLNAAGIQIDVKTVPHDEFWGHVVPAHDYDMVYSWLSCGSIAEPFTSMNRYTSNPLPPSDYRAIAFRNTGLWSTSKAASYSNEVMAIGAKALGDNSVPGLVAHAYQYLSDEMPIIPLVQSPTIVPFNTTHWTGWPAAGGDTVPMTNWAQTMRTIHELTTGKCVRFFRSLPAEINGMKFDVDGGATLAPDSLGQIALANHTVTITFGPNDHRLALSLIANATGKNATVSGLSDTGGSLFSNSPAVSTSSALTVSEAFISQRRPQGFGRLPTLLRQRVLATSQRVGSLFATLRSPT